MRETKIPVEQEAPLGVFICDQAGLVINKFSRGGGEAPGGGGASSRCALLWGREREREGERRRGREEGRERQRCAILVSTDCRGLNGRVQAGGVWVVRVERYDGEFQGNTHAYTGLPH